MPANDEPCLLTLICRWLTRRLRKRCPRFRYTDGRKAREVDPHTILKKLDAHPKLMPSHLYSAATNDPEAQKIVADAACDVFGVMPFNGSTGLTVAERIELMLAFDLWIQIVRKQYGSYQASQNSRW